MGILKSMAGLIRVELTSADLAASFGAISDAGIVLYDSKQLSDLTARVTVLRRDYTKLCRICEKRGDSLRISSRNGIYWTLKGLLRRPVLLMGLVFLLLAAFYLPSRVFFVQVEGNNTVAAKRILEAAEEAGIRFGALRREVRSEKVKNALLEAVPELQWAGVNTYGCVARISVRERSVSENQQEDNTVGSIVAVRDGIITSCTATKGNMLCSIGQAVTEGEVLISGYTDCGIYIRAAQAKGEIYAQTRHELGALMPGNLFERVKNTAEKKKVSLIIGKKRIFLWKDSGISDTICGRMYEEYYVTLPGGFCLPVALAVETISVWEYEAKEIPAETASRILSEFAEDYLKGQMVAGSILSSDTDLQLMRDCYELAGEYVCTEMIGRLQREEIGEYNGKSD